MPRHDYTAPMDGYEIWRFETAHYHIVALACDEDFDPEDSFCDPMDVEFAREGGAHWFCAVVEVRTLDETRAIGRDVLGGCSYHSYKEFVTSHRQAPRNDAAAKAKNIVYCTYFPSMVRQALEEARDNLAQQIAKDCA